MAHITELSHEFCALLRYCAQKSDNSLPTFWDNLMVPSSSVEKSKRTEHNVNLCGTVSINFLKKHDVSKAPTLSIFRQIGT